MFKSQRLLLIGPVVVFLAVLAAESAAGGLDYWPSSEGLWYLNLELFGFLQRSHYFIADFFPFAYGQLLIVAIPILAVAILGQLTKRRLPMAIASNLSFVFAGFAVYCNWFIGAADIRAASLDLSVALAAQRDERRKPENRHVAMMFFDMVDFSRRLDPVPLCAFLTQRKKPKLNLPSFPPAS